MGTYAKHFEAPTSVNVALPGQVENHTGGFVFAVDDWSRLDRFLILGSEGGTYYVGERELTLKNAGIVRQCVTADGLRTVRRIVEISTGGRAPKNEPALLALAICLKHGDQETRKSAADALPSVARIGTHLFHLAAYVKTLGGFGNGVTVKAFARWYQAMGAEKLAYQAIKYQQRDGWSHRDVLRMCHAKSDGARGSVLNWMVKGWPSVGETPHDDAALVKIWAFETAKTASLAQLRKLIADYGLPHECVPNEAKSKREIWEAMLPSMGLTAVIRNLGKMSAVGLIAPLADATKTICGRLRSKEEIASARIHPLALMVASKVYGQGHGDKGDLSWGANRNIVDALDDAFYLAFKSVVPTGKRHLIALDVSGSMGGADIAGMSGITARAASAALSLVTMATESQTEIVGFGHQLVGINISAKTKLSDAITAVSGIPFGATNASLPIEMATAKQIPVDVFVTITDNEVNQGTHPKIALDQYRQRTGIPAKLVVMSMTATECSIADPNDAGMLDIVGMDTATPAVLADFVRG